MKRSLLAGLCLTVLLSTPAFAADSGARALDSAFVKGVKAGDVEAVMALYASDATLYPPGEMAAKGRDTFVLRVRGKSMIEDHIDDGDYVVVQSQNTARDGDIIVALLEDSRATLKRFFREKDRIRLQPANGQMQPIYTRDIQIQGKVIGVIRRLA